MKPTLYNHLCASLKFISIIAAIIASIYLSPCILTGPITIFIVCSIFLNKLFSNYQFSEIKHEISNTEDYSDLGIKIRFIFISFMTSFLVLSLSIYDIIFNNYYILNIITSIDFMNKMPEISRDKILELILGSVLFIPALAALLLGFLILDILKNIIKPFYEWCLKSCIKETKA